MESVRRVFINSLEPYMDHIMIIGVIIGKQNPRIINTNKRGNCSIIYHNSTKLNEYTNIYIIKMSQIYTFFGMGL